MKNSGSVFLLLVALLLSGCASTRPTERPAAAVSTAFTLDELLSKMPPRDSLEARWLYSSIVQMGPQGISALCANLDTLGTDRYARAEHALQGLAAYLVRYGKETDRLMYVTALGEALKRPLAVEQSSFIIARLQVAGKGESIPLLSRFLTDERLCEPAAQAIVAIRDGAEAPLLAALTNAVNPCRITLIKNLGEIRSRGAVDAFLKDAASKDPGTRLAALFALANSGDSRAGQVLSDAATGGLDSERDECTWYYLLFAKRRIETGDSAKAISIAQGLMRSRQSIRENHFRAAALEIIVQVKGQSSLDELIAAVGDSSKQLRIAALELASKITGERATNRWIAASKSVQGERRAEILAMLGRRNDKSAVPAVAEAINDADTTVRSAAIQAAVQLIGADAIPSYMSLLERRSDSANVAGVRKALERLPSAKVIPPVIGALSRLTPPACAMLADLLGSYGTVVPVEPILALASHQNAAVRLAAAKALGSVAGANNQQALTKLLLNSQAEGERQALQKSLVSICSRIEDPAKRSETILETLKVVPPGQQALLLRTLGRIGGASVLQVVAEATRSKDEDIRDAAVRALADWPTIDAYDNLLAIAGSKEKLNLRVLALRGCVRVVENAPISPATAVHYHEKTLAASERLDEKRLVLGALGNLRHKGALRLVIPFIGHDSLGVDAAVAAGKISATKKEWKDGLSPSDVARAFIESEIPSKLRSQVTRSLDAAGGMNNPPEGFAALFNGKNLDGWKGLVANPIIRASMNPHALDSAQQRADSLMRAHWSVADGVLVFDGKGESLCTVKDYGDFEMTVDWKIEKGGDSGIYLRGSPQVQIWDPAQWPEGSGGLYNNQKNPSKPMLRADNPIGEWNTFRVRMIGERVTVHLNDILVVDSVVMENYWDRSIPIFPSGQLELQSHNSPLFFRNIFIRQFPQKRQLFEGSLSNGTDLTGWKIVDGREESWKVADGILRVESGGGGWLSTAREFGNFQLDLDFRVPEGGNSGVFIRSPREGDPAYTGMEIQVLDDSASQYATLKPWQYTGSIYGVQAPSMRATKNPNEWQHMQIVADSAHVMVTLNDRRIIDTDLILHMEKEPIHPGLKRRTGFIGLQNHGSGVEYRNIRIKELR